MGPSSALFVYFRPFFITISEKQIEKQHRWCAWDSNPRPQGADESVGLWRPTLKQKFGCLKKAKFDSNSSLPDFEGMRMNPAFGCRAKRGSRDIGQGHERHLVRPGIEWVVLNKLR